jgi:hypothetical protein
MPDCKNMYHCPMWLLVRQSAAVNFQNHHQVAVQNYGISAEEQ